MNQAIHDDEQVLSVLRNVLRFDSFGRLGVEITAETRLDAIALDSLQMSELVLELEERLGVELTDDMLLKLSSAETIGEFLSGFRAGLPVSPSLAPMRPAL